MKKQLCLVVLIALSCLWAAETISFLLLFPAESIYYKSSQPCSMRIPA